MTATQSDELAALCIFRRRDFGPDSQPFLDGLIRGGRGLFQGCFFEDVMLDLRGPAGPPDFHFYGCEFLRSSVAVPGHSRVTIDGVPVNP